MRHSTALTIGLSASLIEALRNMEPLCEFLATSEPGDAIGVLRGRRFHAILVDAETPGMTPSHFDQLRIAAPETPKVLLGRSADFTFLDGFASSDEFSFLPTEISESIFQSAIHSLLHPRRAERVPMSFRGRRVRGQIEGRSFEHGLIDLSNRGLSFGVGQGESLDGLVPGNAVNGIEIVDANLGCLLGPVRGTVRHCKTEAGSAGSPVVHIGLSFDAPISAQVPYVRVLDEALPIISAIRKASEQGATFTLTPPDTETGHNFALGAIDIAKPATFVLGGPCPPELRVHDPVRLTFSHYGLSYSGFATVLECGEGLRLTLPRTMRIHHRRSSNRHRPGEGRSYLIRLQSQLVGLDDLFPADDINATGLSIVVDANRELVPPGLVLETIEITLPDGGVPISVRGIVRSLHPIAPLQAHSGPRLARCGVEFLGLSDADRNRLSHNLIVDGYPHVEPAGAEDLEAILAFLEEAKFVAHLYRPPEGEKLAAVKNGYGRMLGHGHPLAAHLVYRESGKIRGHITAMRIYSNTILATHLAALQGDSAPADRISRALCMGVSDYTEQQPSVEYVKLMWNRQQAWPNRMFGWSGRAIHHPGLSETRDFAVLVRPNAAPRLPSVDGVVLDEPSQRELLQIEAYFLEQFGLVRVQSEDLTLARLRLDEIGAEYGRFGLRRERRVRVARVDGVMAGFSLLEVSTRAVQLTEVTNGFDVFHLPDVPKPLAAMARLALIGDAVQFYTAEGLSHSVALSEASDLTDFLEAGFTVAISAQCWTWHYTQMRQWTDVWDQLFQKGRTIFGHRAA